MVPHVISSVIPHAVQVFADVAKRYLHEVAAVRQQGSASTSGSLGNRVNLVQRRSQSFFRDEVPQDPAGQVSQLAEKLSVRFLCSQLLLQANYLRQLNQKGDPEAVIRQYEGGRINSTEATLGEYVKALVKVDRLDSTALAHTLQVSLQLLLVCLCLTVPAYAHPSCKSKCCLHSLMQHTNDMY